MSGEELRGGEVALVEHLCINGLSLMIVIRWWSLTQWVNTGWTKIAGIFCGGAKSLAFGNFILMATSSPFSSGASLDITIRTEEMPYLFASKLLTMDKTISGTKG
ncbi:hypothetical protein Fot_23588 [Forsythia ovata]|uniref:Uncharacterized protein n=1 Tax=Forsythia ovata TaxID=205694 RepID=A0ABD1V111_9LAMI